VYFKVLKVLNGVCFNVLKVFEGYEVVKEFKGFYVFSVFR
jgi:hypothetical protein